MGSTTLIRTGSLLVSPRFPVDGHQDPGAGVSFLRRCRSTSHAPRSRCAAALRFEADGGKDGRPLRRVRSEADLLGSNPPPRSGLRNIAAQASSGPTEGSLIPVPTPSTVRRLHKPSSCWSCPDKRSFKMS
ncbi:hypothetical protein Cni_G15723 [Canna indica]|uniref:Uncharacterized protein n=1 Tax=Canna indica TaxID=4628 RepID=A0AAQ3KEA2_9LILI|nr:hypothetical protein Cni_G15723 [Canna indica]